MIVTKIGGSLYHSRHLLDWLSCLSGGHNADMIIVPGGGPFADQVREASRQWNLPEACAHDMAVLGMQQYAHMMLGLDDRLLMVDSIEEILNGPHGGRTMVWAPYKEIVNAQDLDKDWQTTSDSLALWLATKLSASHLCLIKSAPVHGKSLDGLIKTQVIDQRFEHYLDHYPGHVEVFNAADSQIFMERLNRGKFI